MLLLADVNPYLEAPKWLNSGDTAWQLTAATFVGLQSIPGLAILYAGLVKKKWALNSALMVFYAFASVLIVLSLVGYNTSFGNPMKLGAGILWLGWNGFNGGDPFFANSDAGAAVLNTNIATATALLVWLVADMFATGKPNAVSMINGMIAGLVAITPCAGFVNGYGALAVGAVTIVPWLTLNYLSRWSVMKKVDDTFSVLHTHGVAGLVGGLMAGIASDPKMLEYFANKTVKGATDVSVTGWYYGNFAQFVHQAEAAAFIIVLNIVGTYVLLKLISLVVPLRATEDHMEAGDLAIHGMDPIPPFGSQPELADVRA
ncbi:MAG: ammonium transporter [Vulcanimicrobiaceae bacterium]